MARASEKGPFRGQFASRMTLRCPRENEVDRQGKVETTPVLVAHSVSTMAALKTPSAPQQTTLLISFAALFRSSRTAITKRCQSARTPIFTACVLYSPSMGVAQVLATAYADGRGVWSRRSFDQPGGCQPRRNELRERQYQAHRRQHHRARINHTVRSSPPKYPYNHGLRPN